MNDITDDEKDVLLELETGATRSTLGRLAEAPLPALLVTVDFRVAGSLLPDMVLYIQCTITTDRGTGQGRGWVGR
jgi:hypothetical protein